jgi:hypothetical protein
MSLAGIVAFLVALVALHVLRGDLDPAQHTISQYSFGRYGWLMRVGFALLGLGVTATAASLLSIVEPSPWRYVGHLLLIGTAVGLLLDAGFNTDRPRVSETFDGALHGDGTLIVCLTLPAVALILGSDFVRSSVDRSRARWLQVLGAGQYVAILGFQFGPRSYHGLLERLAVAMGLVTLALLSSFARRSPDAWVHRERVSTRRSAIEYDSLLSESGG